MAIGFVERENELLRTIEEFSKKGLDFIVVGGYAVSGLAKHRFSIDLDIIIQRKDLETFQHILKEKGFAKHIEIAGFDQLYGGEFVNFVKKIEELPITVDILVESLVCRTTNASWSFEYVKHCSVIAIVAGIELSTRCNVPERELLTAFKIHSGRRTDVRDFVVLVQNVDIEKIVEHLKRGDLEQLRIQIRNILRMLKDERLVNSLKGVFSVKYDVTEQIKNAQNTLEEIKNRV